MAKYGPLAAGCIATGGAYFSQAASAAAAAQHSPDIATIAITTVGASLLSNFERTPSTEKCGALELQ